jgi:hypothetical protein
MHGARNIKHTKHYYIPAWNMWVTLLFYIQKVVVSNSNPRDVIPWSRFLVVFFVCLRKVLDSIVYVLLGISPASICSFPTFRNHVSVPSSKAGSRLSTSSLWIWNWYMVPKRRQTTYWRRGKYPKEQIQYSNHGESLKSRILDSTSN